MKCGSAKRTRSSTNGPRRARVRASQKISYENAYLFGAVCPNRDTGAAIIMPHANTAAMRKHLEEISRAVAPGAHGLIILDQAGWHTTRKLKIRQRFAGPACPMHSGAYRFRGSFRVERRTELGLGHSQSVACLMLCFGSDARRPRPAACGCPATSFSAVDKQDKRGRVGCSLPSPYNRGV